MGNCLTGQTANTQLPPSGIQAQKPDEGPAFPPVNKTELLQHSMLGKAHAEDVTEFYDIGQVLGAGRFGTTRVAISKATGERYACKSINKARLAGMESTSSVKNELQIMHHVAGHPNIVSLKEAFEDHAYVHLVMELCQGGDLVERIMAKGSYTEADAAAAIRKMLRVVAFCHEMGVVHRDLKPDNFLLTTPTNDAELKATDFGLSAFIKRGQKLQEVCGTSFYMAPEVLLGEYDEAADVWAMGVILYILLCGRPPFEHALDEEIFRMIVDDGKPDFSSYIWDNITEPAKECVRLMMTYNPKHRPTARQMLDHEWIREGGVAGGNVIEPEVVRRMRSFAAMNKLKKQALLFIGQHLSPDEIKGLQELFASLDVDGGGTITLDELRQGLISRGAALPEDELQALMELADVDGNKEIDYEEFVAATLHVCKLQQEQVLIQAFKHFDKDNSGYITRDELEEAFRDKAFSAQQLLGDIDSVLAQVDKNGDGLIDYAEFCQMMLPSDALNQFHAAKFPRHRAARRVQLDTATVRADQRLPAVDAACA